MGDAEIDRAFGALLLEVDTSIVGHLRGVVDRALAAEREAWTRRFATLRADCMATYMGGHKNDHDVEVFQHGMATVCNVVNAIVRGAAKKETT